MSLINEYERLYPKDIIKDLKSISSNYGIITMILEPFIRFNIVKEISS